MDKTFNFVDFAPFFAILNKFIDKDFGHNFDLKNDFHKSLLDMLCNYEEFVLKNKLLKPTQLITTLVKKNVKTLDYKYMYFKDTQEVYMLDDNKIWDYFDHPFS